MGTAPITLVPRIPAGSGLYPIIEVDGHHPDIPTDFVGANTITVAVAGVPRRLADPGKVLDRC